MIMLKLLGPVSGEPGQSSFQLSQPKDHPPPPRQRDREAQPGSSQQCSLNRSLFRSISSFLELERQDTRQSDNQTIRHQTIRRSNDRTLDWQPALTVPTV